MHYCSRPYWILEEVHKASVLHDNRDLCSDFYKLHVCFTRLHLFIGKLKLYLTEM